MFVGFHQRLSTHLGLQEFLGANLRLVPPEIAWNYRGVGPSLEVLTDVLS